MATAYTSLLGLALPVTGELSGTWGNTVNTEITSLLDSAIAGTTTISADADITLTTTTGAANESREAIILWTAGGTTTRNITAPAQSKAYIVINKSSSTQSIVLRGAGPTTGVTIIKGESAVCAWNGTDFIKVSNISGAGVFSSITNTGLTSGRVVFSTTNGLETDSANLTFNGTILTAAGFSGPLNGTVGATTPTTGAFTTLSATGVATFSAGTAALPAITTTGDTNTGIFFPAADTIAFSEGGAESMRIDSSGNLGIGTTSPAAKLQVNAATDTIKTLGTSYNQQIYDCSAGFSQAVWQYIGVSKALINASASGMLINTAADATAPMVFGTGSGSTERMRIDSSGNVGIGTASPTQRLTVKSATNGSQLGIDNAGAQYTSFNIYNNGTNKVGIEYDNTNSHFILNAIAASSQIILKTVDTERMLIDSSGNVGINNSSPLSRLDVRATAGELGRFSISNTGVGYLLIGGGASTTEGLRLTYDNSDGSSTINNFYNASLKFATNNTERMRIDTSGNLLVGTTSLPSGGGILTASSSAAETKVSINNTGTSGRHYWLGSTNTSSGALGGGKFAIYDQTANAARLVIDSSGNVGIGTTSPAVNFHVAGTVGFNVNSQSVPTPDNGSVPVTVFTNNYSSGSGESSIWNTGAALTGGIRLMQVTGSGTYNDMAWFQKNAALFYTGNTERMRIDSSGNVMVGTTSSSLSGQSVNGIIVSRVGAALLGLNNSSNTHQAWSHFIYDSGLGAAGTYSIGQIVNGSTSGLAGGPFTPILNIAVPSAASNSPKVIIDSSGNVGIGKTATNKQLEIFGTTNPALRIQNSTTGTGGGDGLLIEMSGSDALFVNYESANLIFQTAGNERMRLDSSGNLFLNCTSTPTSNSTGIINAVSGGDGVNLKQTADGNNMLNLWQTGTNGFTAISFNKGSTQTGVGSITCSTTATAYNTSSDYRLKQDIAPMTGALAKIAALKPVTYKWKLDGSDAEGFIAHELAEVCPQAVSGAKDAVDADGNPKYQGIDVSFLVATLTAAIQEQQALITSLTARIVALESN